MSLPFKSPNLKSKIRTNLLLPILFCLFLISDPAARDSSRIIGNWLTEKGRAIFQIYKKDGKYFGKLAWSESPDGKDGNNPDKSLRDRKTLGLDLLTDLIYNPKRKRWDKGRIYNPEDGHTYSSHCTISDDGTRLYFRGFLGISLLGKTQTWTRVEKIPAIDTARTNSTNID